MSRPKADLPPADILRAQFDKEGRLAVRVTPGARSEGIFIENGHVLVKVRAKPQNGAANIAVEKIIANALGIAPSRCRLLRGSTSREKLLEAEF